MSHAAPGDADRQQSAEMLRQTRAMLAFALDSAQVGDWDLDLIEDTSRRSLRHDQCFGYASAIPEAQWGIEAFVRHVHPLDRDRIDAGLRGAVQRQQDWGDEFRVIWPDGSLHWLAARGSIYRPVSGPATRMLGIVRDISARKRAEEALAASEKMARGQVVALRETLEALALDESPDRLAQHISRSITAQLSAHSNSVWRRNATSGRIGFEFAFENGAYVSKTDPRIAGASLWLPMDAALPWPAPLRAGCHCLVEDIADIPPFDLRDRLADMGVVTVLMVPMMMDGHLDGVVAIRYAHRRAFRADEIEFAKTLASQAVLALQLSRLSSERRDAAVTAERNRMARDMHGALAQGYGAIIAQLDAAADAMRRGENGAAAAIVEQAGTLARDSLGEARRLVLALRPQAPGTVDLVQALAALFDTPAQDGAVKVDFGMQGVARALPADWQDKLLRIGEEALNNALRHGAPRTVHATLAFSDDGVRLAVADDGRGFDPQVRSDGFGLVGMRERAEQMGGVLRIDSAPGRGATVSVEMPLAD